MKIALIGYGKMGRMVEAAALGRGHQIVSIIDVDNTADFGSEAFASADVAIEFTAPQAALDNVRRAFAAGVKVVSGTTGWLAKHEEEMRQRCEQQGATLFWSSNYSIGVAVMAAVNRYLADIMNRIDGYDVCIDEVHHCHKLDAPSGTAITLADDIIARLDRKTAWADTLAPLGEVERCQEPVRDDLLHIFSYRHDEVPGIHSVHYISAADTITLTHDAKSRSGFALGAVLAAEYTARHTGLLGMQDLCKEWGL